MTISIQDIGAVEGTVGFSPNPEGGVWLVKGPNGSGKTTLINTVRSAMSDGNKTRLTPRDGVRAGSAQIAGAFLHVGGRTQRSGELALLGIDGRLNLSRFVDPGLKDEAAADRARIEELATLTGIKPDVSLFYDLAGGQEQLEAVLNADAIARAIKSGDIVELADQVAKDLHKAARDAESKSQIELGHAQAQQALFQDVETSIETDDAKLQAALQEAHNHVAQLQHKQETAWQARDKAEQAQKKLDAAQAQYCGGTVEDAQAEITRCGEALDFAKQDRDSIAEKLRDLERQLDQAKAKVTAKQMDYDRAVERRDNAVQHQNMLATWKDTISQVSNFQAPSGDELMSAEQAVITARVNIEKGRKAREALAAREKAGLHSLAAQRHQEAAVRFRDAARGTDEVLSKLVASDVLRVVEGRLQAQHPKREWIAFHEFSPGERWKVALKIAIQRIRDEEGTHPDFPALIPIPQSAWGDLQPAVQREIWELAKAERVCILAEQPDDQPIRIEEFVPAA